MPAGEYSNPRYQSMWTSEFATCLNWIAWSLAAKLVSCKWPLFSIPIRCILSFGDPFLDVSGPAHLQVFFTGAGPQVQPMIPWPIQQAIWMPFFYQNPLSVLLQRILYKNNFKNFSQLMFFWHKPLSMCLFKIGKSVTMIPRSSADPVFLWLASLSIESLRSPSVWSLQPQSHNDSIIKRISNILATKKIGVYIICI